MEQLETPSLPRSVFVAADRSYAEIAGDRRWIELLEDLDSMVVPHTADPEVNPVQVTAVRQLLSAAGQLTPGSLLVKNPYNETGYELAEFAVETFASAKYHALANVARLLGARNVSFVEATVEQTKSTWVADLKAKFTAGSGGADTGLEVEKRVEASLKGELNFLGGEADVDAAIDYIQRRRLTSDQQLEHLVQMRSSGNLMENYRMTFNGLKESDVSFRAALNLANAGPVKALGVGASFSRTVTSLSRIEIVIQISF